MADCDEQKDQPGRRLTPLDGNSQRLDGGAMFGNAPRALWSRWIEPDELGRIPLACRSLLVQEQGQRILLETGIGAFFPPALRDRFGVEQEGHGLLAELEALGLSDEEIDVVVLSHLHFDHAGGLLAPFAEGKPHRLLFPNATFVVSADAFARASAPHRRDRASFIAELPALLTASKRLELVERDGAAAALPSSYRLHWSDGHTPGMLLVELPAQGQEGPLVFAGDLVPGAPWVHLPITMGYDRFRELLIAEKQALFEDLIGRNGRLCFTHDHQLAIGKLSRDERGRYRALPE